MSRTALSARECEVLLWLAPTKTRQGESFKWIAERRMGVSVGTCTRLAQRAYKKLGVRDRDEAVLAHPWHRVQPFGPCLRFVTPASLGGHDKAA